MRVAVNRTTLWFDIVGSGLVPEGGRMRARPTIILVHGGPGGYDHSYFRPSFDRLAEHAQIVYLDLREHGRSARGDPASWSFEACADDLAAFCDALGIVAPIVIGHSMGGMVALVYGERHAGHAGGLVVVGAMARYDVPRIAEGFRRVAGDEVAELARRSYADEDVSDDEWERVRVAFGPRVLSDDERQRMSRNPKLGASADAQMVAFDIVNDLRLITVPTLVVVGSLDPVTPVPAAEEIQRGLRAGVGRLEVIEGAGHWPWLDTPDTLWHLIADFVAPFADRSATSSW
jgi:proline iminopeptidase